MSERKIIRVQDVMKKRFDMVDRLDTIEDALNQMVHFDTKCLLVNKRDDDDEYGIVMISDIARQVLAKDRPLDRVNIYEIMTKPVLSVKPDMDIRYCARLFNHFHLSRAPVTKHGEVVGIISLSDMVRKGLRNP